MPTASVNLKIANRLGLHARPAMSLVDVASGFSSDIKIAKGPQVVDAKSIMQLMMLAATHGTTLTVTAEGSDAEAAVAAISALVDGKFDEE
ncbi:MAG: HPr family phosphocarrier protein [Planctomycetota bacterium]